MTASRTEQDALRLYGRLSRREMIARVRRQMHLGDDAFPRNDIPFLHRQTATRPQARPYNLVATGTRTVRGIEATVTGFLPMPGDSTVKLGLAQSGIDAEHPMVGRDLLATPPDPPGRAVMQHDLTHAYRVGDQVVIHQPFRAPRQFTSRDGRLAPTTLDRELARDALAHADMPAMLYRERAHRLPN